jgi:non-heme chloroperoxidase
VSAQAEAQQIESANASGNTPVVFIHGLWLLPSSWDRWAQLFAAEGYAPVQPNWPGDQPTVEQARANPDSVAEASIAQVVDHTVDVILALDQKPVLVGHSFGGMFTQMIAGRGLAAASVAIDPAPFRGIFTLPISTLRSAAPILMNPLNRGRAKSLTLEQFKYGWANALEERQAERLYEEFHVPGAARLLFEGANANLNPGSQAKVDTKTPERGPLLLISGDSDNTVPTSIVHAEFKKQQKNPRETEFETITNRGHSLTIDDGWQEVAQTALAFANRFA